MCAFSEQIDGRDGRNYSQTQSQCNRDWLALHHADALFRFHLLGCHYIFSTLVSWRTIKHLLILLSISLFLYLFSHFLSLSHSFTVNAYHLRKMIPNQLRVMDHIHVTCYCKGCIAVA